MKIDGKKQADISCGFSGVTSSPCQQHAPATPRLVARTATAGRLMSADGADHTAAALPGASGQQMHWQPFAAFRASMAAADAAPTDAAEPGTPHSLREGGPRAAPDLPEAAVSFDETPGDPRIVPAQRENAALYFAATWPTRLPHRQQQHLEQGCYSLLEADGSPRPCTSYGEFVEYVRGGAAGPLPDFILHVAGPQLHNFLCRTYLYNPALALFGHAGGRRVEPVPNLRTRFELDRRPDGSVNVGFAAIDDRLDRIMLVGCRDYDEHEVQPLGRAEIRFSGNLLFAPDGRYAVGPVQVRASGLHLPEPEAARTADSFA